MIEDFYRIGLCTQRSLQQNQLDEDLMPNTSVKLDGIIAIDINADGNYQGLRFMESSKDTLLGTLLKKKSSNGPNYAPTAQITEIEKTLSKKIIAWFKEFKKESENLDEQSKVTIQSIYKNLESEKNRIIADYTALSLNKGSYALTVIYDSQLPINVPFIFDSYAASLRGKKESAGTGTCCLCDKTNAEIIPKSDVFKFYTIDKPGNISGGFNNDRAWMNYPICSQCDTILERGKAYVWKNLYFPYYGIGYYLIPSTRSLSSLNDIKEILEDINQKKFSFEERSQKSTQYTQREIWDIITDNNDINSFHLLFIQSEQSGQVERIRLELRDIYSLHIQRLYQSKKNIDQRFNLEEPGFNFGYIRKFFLKSDRNNRDNDLDQLFLDITRSIFLEKKIESRILFTHFMREIRFSLENETIFLFRDKALRALICLEYLCKSNCIKIEGRMKMAQPLNDVFQKYGTGLDTDLKRALFLIGALVSKVMDVQYANLSSTPFQNRFRGMKMRQEHVEGLLNEAIDKLREYKSYSASSKQLVIAITQLILQSPPVWPLTVDQINFYTSAGMALYKEVYLQFVQPENKLDDKEENQ